MASTRPSQIPSIRKSGVNIVNSENNFFAPTNIPSTIKINRTSNNALAFNSVSKASASSRFNSTNRSSSNNFLYNNMPSTIRSESRARISNNSNFGSVQKNAVKLFGMTPKTNRSSFMQNIAASTTRLSRSSMSSRQAKDNRLLSDATYQRECQEKIVDFLTMNGYPNQITRQNLTRLSLSDASRIFQFLFSFFSEDVVIKNGPDTSLDVVVPKMMSLFGYPYPIKKSDLVSFSGGRQLGAVLSMIDFLIDYINYFINLDVSRIIGRDFVSWSDDDSNVDINKVLPKIHDLACRIENENWENDKIKILNDLNEELYGNENEVTRYRKEVDNLEQTLIKLDEELAYLEELPNRKQELVIDIENCEKYIIDMIEHNKAKSDIKNALLEEIRSNKESFKSLMIENKRLESEVNAQKDVQIEYKYAIERRKQIQEEIEEVELQNKNTKEMISSLNLEINKEKSQLESLINDFEEMINIIFNLYKNSKIHKFLPDSLINFEKDKEWTIFFDNFEKVKNLNIENVNTKTFMELRELSLKKFRDFKMHLVEKATKLKTTISLEVVCKNQERQKHRDQLKQEASDLEAQIQNLWTEKNQKEEEHQIELKNLDSQVESLRQKLINHEKLLNNEESSLKRLEDQIKNKKDEIIIKKYTIMKNFQEIIEKDKKYEDELIARIDSETENLERQNKLLEETLQKLIKV